MQIKVLKCHLTPKFSIEWNTIEQVKEKNKLFLKFNTDKSQNCVEQNIGIHVYLKNTLFLYINYYIYKYLKQWKRPWKLYKQN